MPQTYLDLITREFKPKIESLRDDIALRKDPDYFWSTGTQVYCGRQGSGKTTAAVKHATIDLKKIYPKAILVSNLNLEHYNQKRITADKDKMLEIAQGFNTTTDYIFFETIDELQLALTKINNAHRGVIYLIDEIHTYFNALESKNMPMWVFTEIAQQRKQRKCIIGTSQIFLRMAKPFREQCASLIVCSTMMGFITRMWAYDGMSLTQNYNGEMFGTVKKSGWFFHTRYLRNAFDTYQKINGGGGAIEFEQLDQPTLEKSKILKRDKKVRA